MMITLPEAGSGLVAGRPELPFKRLPVPLDGSELAERALPFARRLARLGGGDLLLVRTALSQPGRGESAVAQVETAADAERYLRRLMSGFNADFAVEAAAPCGDPVTEIAGIAAQRNVDLVVMTTHGRTGLGRLVLGSVADGLVRRTRLPLSPIRAGLTAHRWERRYPPGPWCRLTAPSRRSRSAGGRRAGRGREGETDAASGHWPQMP